MQDWHYGKGLIYFRPIIRLIKLAFLRARAVADLGEGTAPLVSGSGLPPLIFTGLDLPL